MAVNLGRVSAQGPATKENNMPKEISGTLPAYLIARSSLLDPTALYEAFNADDQSQETKNRILSRLTMSSDDWITKDGDYIPVGTVRVSFSVMDADQMVRGQVSALQEQRKKVLADAQVQAMRIDDQISKLQALTFDDPKGRR